MPEVYEEVRSGQVKGVDGAAKLTAYRRNVVVDYDAEGEKDIKAEQPSLFDFRRAVPYEPLITRLGE